MFQIILKFVNTDCMHFRQITSKKSKTLNSGVPLPSYLAGKVVEIYKMN